MIKYTQKQLKQMESNGIAISLTHCNIENADEIRKKESYLSQVGYSAGIYGCNGMLLKGHTTGALYVISARTQAIYLF